MRVIVDENLCGTTGQCVLTLPSVFHQREADGIAVVCLATVPEELREAVLLTVSQCPVAAIRIVATAPGEPAVQATGPGRVTSNDGMGADDEAT